MYRKLKKWREERGLENTVGNIELNIYEELLELMGVESKFIEILKEDFFNNVMVTYQQDIPEEDKIDALSDIRVFCINGTEAMGYNAEIAMDETIKEISSRKGAYNKKSEKWEKFKDKESMKLWYKANYSKAKK